MPGLTGRNGACARSRQGEDTEDTLDWVKFSGASWAHDGSGFFYSRYDAPPPGEELQQTNYFQKLYFHRLGTPPERGRADL